MSTSIHDTVAHLAAQIDCELLPYTQLSQPPQKPGPVRHLFSVGPYAIGLWHPGDEVHLVCLTDNSSNTFWEYIAEKLNREDLPKHDCIVSESHGQHEIWLHYCSIPRHFDLATVEAYGFPKHSDFIYVPQDVRQNLTWLHHTWQLQASLGDRIDIFRDTYHGLRSWAEAAGIFSKSFGTLDAESLVWMLFSVMQSAVENNMDEPSAFSSRLHAFADKYSKRYEVLSVLTQVRSRAYHLPRYTPVTCCTAIAHEIRKLAEQPKLLKLSPEHYYQNFCDRYSAVILITAECWLPKRRESFHSDLVKEISSLPKRSREAGSNLNSFRIWPQAFKPSADEWVYVVGVRLPRSPNSSPSRSTSARTSSETTSKQYLTLDDTVGTSAIRVCSAQEAKSLPERYSVAATLASYTPSEAPALACSGPLSTGNKFPPASQALSRLRCDPAHIPYEYEVGYLDRFEGLMWLPLEQWGREIEDEEFIPEHRIRILKRVGKGGDGIVVWDREERICRLS
ncbi:hypothetical protein Q7P35_005959 [Cladosporium inversicolor]